LRHAVQNPSTGRQEFGTIAASLTVCYFYAIIVLAHILCHGVVSIQNRTEKIVQKEYVSAIVCTYNEEKCIRQCIASLLASDPRIAELIVVDDNSTDATRTRVEELQDRRIKFVIKGKELNRGKNDSLWIGAHHATYQNLLILDADTKTKSTTDMIDRLQSGTDLVGGIIDIISDESYLARCEAAEYRISIRKARPWLFRKFGYINNISGAFFGIKKARLLEKRIPASVIGEDFYLTQIAIRNGWKIDLSNSVVETYATPGIKALFIQRCRWVNGFYSVILNTKRFVPLVEMITVYYRTLATVAALIFGIALTGHFWLLTIIVLYLYFLNEYYHTKSIRASLEMMLYRQINFISAICFPLFGRKWRVIR